MGDCSLKPSNLIVLLNRFDSRVGWTLFIKWISCVRFILACCSLGLFGFSSTVIVSEAGGFGTPPLKLKMLVLIPLKELS